MDLLTVGIVKVTAPPKGTSHGVLVHAGGHLIPAGERWSPGESGAGPAPYDLVLAGLGACTFITLQMHAARRRWPIDTMQIVLRMTGSDKGLQIERTVSIEGLDGRQKAQLAIIAEQTPVTLTLRSGAAIKTVFT
ncbi:OsmC family protein [Bosea sp. 2KB_26]|uniref:OsmC family protein n=1 Tax=Bosea sp. 2KB_26 TaxID=3237475 RepID=UPI003F910133